MPKTKPATPIPNCRRCDAPVTVSRARQKLSEDGKQVTHVWVSCANGHGWWSRNKKALAVKGEA